MTKQQSDSSVKSGNRKSYSGVEVLQVLWVLQEYTDEDHPFSVKQIASKARELYGDEAVPGDKKIRDCVEAIRGWSEIEGERDRVGLVKEFDEQEDAAAAYHPVRPPVVKAGKTGNTTCYYVQRHGYVDDEVADLTNAFSAFLSIVTPKNSTLVPELFPFEVESRLPGAGSGTPDDKRGWDPQEILAMVALLKRAIKEKKAISFFQVHFSPPKKTGAPPKMEPFANAPVDQNRVIQCRWPYAVKAIDGRFYVLVNGSGKRADLAPYPVDEIAGLHIIDPDDPKDEYGEPVTLKERKSFDEDVENYFDGAVSGFGATKKVKHKVKIDLLCKGDAFHEAYKRFSNFDFCILPNSKRAKDMDDIEEAMRPDAVNSRDANTWVEVTFMAYPHGVELWAKQNPRDVVMVSPEDEYKRVRAYIGDSRYEFGRKPLDNLVKLFDVHGGVIPGDLLGIDELDDSEKKLVAAYRKAKADAKAEAEEKAKARGKNAGKQ